MKIQAFVFKFWPILQSNNILFLKPRDAAVGFSVMVSLNYVLRNSFADKKAGHLDRPHLIPYFSPAVPA